jgi:hypothetical protein
LQHETTHQIPTFDESEMLKTISLLLALTVAASSPLQAQRVDVYLGPTNQQTVTLSSTDTTILSVRVYNKLGARMATFSPVTWRVNSHCLSNGVVVDSLDAVVNGKQWIARPGCVVPIGYIVASVSVAGYLVKDSVAIVPIPENPSPTPGSALDICLTAASDVMTSSANGFSFVLALDGANRRIPITEGVNFIKPSFPSTSTMQVQYYAYACGPGWQAFDFTRSVNARWSSSNTAAATVNTTGLATIKQSAGWGIGAEYRWP